MVFEQPKGTVIANYDGPVCPATLVVLHADGTTFVRDGTTERSPLHPDRSRARCEAGVRRQRSSSRREGQPHHHPAGPRAAYGGAADGMRRATGPAALLMPRSV